MRLLISFVMYVYVFFSSHKAKHNYRLVNFVLQDHVISGDANSTRYYFPQEPTIQRSRRPFFLLSLSVCEPFFILSLDNAMPLTLRREDKKARNCKKFSVLHEAATPAPVRVVPLIFPSWQPRPLLPASRLYLTSAQKPHFVP